VYFFFLSFFFFFFFFYFKTKTKTKTKTKQNHHTQLEVGRDDERAEHARGRVVGLGGERAVHADDRDAVPGLGKVDQIGVEDNLDRPRQLPGGRALGHLLQRDCLVVAARVFRANVGSARARLKFQESGARFQLSTIIIRS
jgi:hypothetical protein